MKVTHYNQIYNKFLRALIWEDSLLKICEYSLYLETQFPYECLKTSFSLFLLEVECPKDLTQRYKTTNVLLTTTLLFLRLGFVSIHLITLQSFGNVYLTPRKFFKFNCQQENSWLLCSGIFFWLSWIETWLARQRLFLIWECTLYIITNLPPKGIILPIFLCPDTAQSEFG